MIERNKALTIKSDTTDSHWIETILQFSINQAKRFIGRQPCALCGFNKLPYNHIHHRITIKEGGTNHIRNLISLCPNCHSLVHRGKIVLRKPSIRYAFGRTVDLRSGKEKSSVFMLVGEGDREKCVIDRCSSKVSVY